MGRRRVGRRQLSNAPEPYRLVVRARGHEPAVWGEGDAVNPAAVALERAARCLCCSIASK